MFERIRKFSSLPLTKKLAWVMLIESLVLAVINISFPDISKLSTDNQTSVYRYLATQRAVATQFAEAERMSNLTALTQISGASATSFLMAQETPEASELAIIRIEIQNINARLSLQSTQLSSLKTQVASLKEAGDSAVTDDVGGIGERVAAMEEIIQTDPQKAVSMLLLQNDLQNTKQQLETIADYNKWVLGIMLTMTLGLASILLGVFNRAKTTAKAKKEQ